MIGNSILPPSYDSVPIKIRDRLKQHDSVPISTPEGEMLRGLTPYGDSASPSYPSNVVRVQDRLKLADRL